MSFPCLVCGELPLVSHQGGLNTCHGGAVASSPLQGGARGNNPSMSSVSNKKMGGTTIRTLSKDVSDKIFQNLCRHLYVKTEPYWFIQNPGEQMPLCATCSAVVLDIFTLQTKVDQFQAMIKKHIWKLERVVADTEIAGNWMATREEQENEETMWNNIPCPPLAIRIARERHHKFRQQVLQNFKSKVKLRQKMRAAGQQGDEMSEIEPTFTVSLSEPVFDYEKPDAIQFRCSPAAKKPRLDDHGRNTCPALFSTRSASSIPPISVSTGSLMNMRQPHNSALSTSTVPGMAPQSQPLTAISNIQSRAEFVDESEMSDDQNSEMYPDVQIVCSAGSIDYLKEESEYSNSGEVEDSTLEQDGGFWNQNDNDVEDEEDIVIPEGEEVVWLAPGVALRKAFVDQLQTEQLKPSVFLRKLAFAVFGLSRIANSSGITGSTKPGAKPSLDRYKFEALREFTIDQYGIRENLSELEDLNRKIRTICCDARKALKRKISKPLPMHSNLMECISFEGNPNSSVTAVITTTTTPPDADEASVTEIIEEENSIQIQQATSLEQ